MHFVEKEVTYIYSQCEANFPSRNKLFKYLRKEYRKSRSQKSDTKPGLSKQALDKFAPLITNNAYMDTIIKSTAELSHNAKPGYNFRSWKYTTMKVQYSPDSNAEESDISPDTDYGVTLGDRVYLRKYIPNLEIKKLPISIPVRGVSNKIMSTSEYAMVTVYIKDLVDGISKMACLTMEVHIVNDLKANILIDTDILTPQGMTVDLEVRVVKLRKYQGLEVPIDVVARTQSRSKRIIRTKSSIILAPGITTEVPVAYKGIIPEDRDFLFEPDCA